MIRCGGAANKTVDHNSNRFVLCEINTRKVRPGAQQAARPAVQLVRHGGVAGGAAALGRLSGRRVAGFCAAWWWDIIFQAARTILVIVCAVQCGSSRHHGLPAMRKSKSKSRRRRPPTHAVR